MTTTDSVSRMLATQKEATTAMRKAYPGCGFYSFGPAEPRDGKELLRGLEYEGTYSFPDGKLETYWFWHSPYTGNLLSLLKEAVSA